jgi:uncharacterized protein (DUF2252 family)
VTATTSGEPAPRVPPEQRAALGKAARAAAPLESHAEFRAAPGRDPVALLLRQAETRVPELVPIRHGRMLVSPFTFYRGAALVMAADLAATPTSGLRTQLCGDAHLANFGAYASPERRLVFDINDFDETLPGPFDWDVKRLAASIVVAGRDNGLTAKHTRRTALAGVESYRTAMRGFAAQPILDVWYSRLDVEDAITEYRSTLSPRELKADSADIKATDKLVAKAHTRTSLQAIGKLTSTESGRRRIVSDPPLVVPIEDFGLDADAYRARLDRLVDTYRVTLQSDRRHLIDHFTLSDVAHKVVGVGSVGTRAWILLLEGGSPTDALLIQAKQAEVSVLADYAGASEHANQGERVVAGQHLMQASSDIFLGWLRTDDAGAFPGEDYYVRQLRDWKVAPEIESMSPRSLELYARLCGWTLARAHARAGDRIVIAGYLGHSAKFDNAVADFAETYADQNERDHAALAAAAADGRVEARSGL